MQTANDAAQTCSHGSGAENAAQAFSGARLCRWSAVMEHQIEKPRSPARSYLDVALMVATWFGVTAMGFGLFSWLSAVLTPALVVSWIARIFG